MSIENDNLLQAEGENLENNSNSDSPESAKSEKGNHEETPVNKGEDVESTPDSVNSTEEGKNLEGKSDSNPEEVKGSETKEKPKSEEKDFDDTADHDQSSDEHHDEEEKVEVPEKDYAALTMEDLVKEAKDLLKNYTPFQIKDAFYGIKDAFRKGLEEEENAEKEKFLAAGGNEIDFRYDHPERQNFNALFAEFRAQLDAFYKQREKEQKENLAERKAIIEELKALYTEPSENNSQIFKTFRDLKTRWHNAGRIPRAEANNIFRTYYFHLDNFNEFLDLNQELRKMDYEHNLEIRHSIIERSKQLLEESNVQKALNELQYLHRMWKEEAVPVAEEHREPTWQIFKELTAKIHDRKFELNEKLQQEQKDNLAKKQEIIATITALLEGEPIEKHNVWQKKIKQMNKLRDDFFATGRVPREVNQEIWNQFKEASREFNHAKNNFYKELKNEQMENLEKKRKLVEIAKEHENSTDWNNSVRIVKQIQSEWKKIGHVPRKYSDKIWNEFHTANNNFFLRYKNRNNEKLEEQHNNLKVKQELLNEMEAATTPKEKEALLDWINKYTTEWSQIGYVPSGKQDINKAFNELIGKILENSGFSKNAIEEAQWESKINHIINNRDAAQLRHLKADIRKQIDEVQKEVTHLQTNLSFFSNADDSNPLFKNAIHNIESKVEELDNLKNKYDELRRIDLSEPEEDNSEDEQESQEDSLDNQE